MSFFAPVQRLKLQFSHFALPHALVLRIFNNRCSVDCEIFTHLEASFSYHLVGTRTKSGSFNVQHTFTDRCP